jgi:hypothetical protein
MYKKHLKLAVFIGVMLAATLACNTITLGMDQPAPIPTNTPIPPPTQEPLPTQEILPTTAAPITNEILFQDDFSNTASGWDVYDDTEGSTNYSNGKYNITVKTNEMFYWANPYRDFTDVIVEVVVEKTTEGDDVQVGIVCRHQDVDNWYALIITTDGFAAIRKRFQGGELEFITEWQDVLNSVQTGQGTNLLRAECVGNRISLFANGDLVAEVFDSDISSGDVGLLAGTFENTNYLEVYFDNFVVYRP